MHIGKKTVVRTVKVATAGAAAIAVGVFGHISPANAEGAGVSVGSSTITAGPASVIADLPLPCIQTVGNNTITLQNVGTVGAVQASPPAAAEYAGPSEAFINLPQFHFGPHGTDDDCNGVPDAIDVQSWTVKSNTLIVGGVGTADCSGNDGSYLRVTNAYTITLTGTCTVTTPVLGSVTGPTTFVFSGNQNPCLGDFGVPNCEPPLEDTEFEGVYVQAPA